MNKQEILEEVKNYFNIKELVGKTVYRIYKERAWRFLDIELLHVLLTIRKNIGKPITVNNWHIGGKFSQRGLRTNVQTIFRNMFKKRKLYLSAHVLGKAVDFDVKGMTAIEVREWIKSNKHIFDKNTKIRLENNKKGKPINWVHVDVIWEKHNSKIYLFDV